jgi:uncharacterized protein YbdZ (MbtH family)
MYRGPSRYFKVVCSPEQHLSVWHAEALVPGLWRETERYGTVDECWNFIEERHGEQGYVFQLNNSGD